MIGVKEMAVADAFLSAQLTEWILVEVKYQTKTQDGDISVSSVYTEKSYPPKTYDNSRGFTTVFPPCEYEKAREYAAHIAAELGIGACV